MKKLKEEVTAALDRVPTRSRQFLTVGALGLVGFGVLWIALASGTSEPPKRNPNAPAPGELKPTNVDLMAPGAQLRDTEVWIGAAGREVAQYKSEREEQKRINRERKEAEDDIRKRFAELEQKIRTPVPVPDPKPVQPMPPAPVPLASRAPDLPPNSSPARPGALPPPPGSLPARPGMPPGVPQSMQAGFDQPIQPSVPALVRVTLAGAKGKEPDAAGQPSSKAGPQSIETFLPVSFTRGVLLGGLDAPTGGQSQTNPHPILIRLSDNSVLPNRFRAEYRECFVVAAGYGDISSERAYLRTESLSCVRADGTAIEVKIQGSVYGEDGKVGMRGRLVTKQGQMLANALMAGVVSGIGQGIATSSTTTSTTALGTVATATGSDNLKAGVGSGVGRALDRLAQYYIKLAEQTFPVIEIDAGREVDVVITKGVHIEGSETAKTSHTQYPRPQEPADRYMKAIRDEEE